MALRLPLLPLLPLLLASVPLVFTSAIRHHRRAKSPRVEAEHLSLSVSPQIAVAGDYESYRGKPYVVGWDDRTFTINGARKLILSGAIHYPRSTPGMWPGLMAKARAAGLNTVETYVFWNLHEPLYREYDFVTDRKNLLYFLKCAQDAGLFVMLRVGPYVCAEWNYGGVPAWTRAMGMQIRTMDELWLHEMYVFFDKIVKMVEPFLARHGGPIIITQIENEYGNIESHYGKNGTEYVKWCGATATKLNTDTAWIMCQQDDAPDNTVNTLNGFYVDNRLASHFAHHSTPGVWTENWAGWFQDWGNPKELRPTEDVAFAVARFFQRGGTAMNYYMFHGGTSFGRTAGGPFITTSYDYDVQLNEYGLPAEPKYSHTAVLHKLLAHYEAALVINPVSKAHSLGARQEAHQYGPLAFLANWDAKLDEQVTYGSLTVILPSWSVTLFDLSDPKYPKRLYCTSEVAKVPEHVTVEVDTPVSAVEYLLDAVGGAPESMQVTALGPMEQVSVTQDTTDYLWSVVPVLIHSAGELKLSVAAARNYIYVYLNGQLQAAANGFQQPTSFKIQAPSPGKHTLQILTMSMGLDNYGEFFDRNRQGLVAPISLDSVDLSNLTWTHVNGTLGELRNFHLPGAAPQEWTELSAPLAVPLVWYRMSVPIAAVLENTTYTLNLTTMGKGAAYVNGHHIGRYWSIMAKGSCQPCDFHGGFHAGKCQSGCGKPTQSLYHVPRDWLVKGDNTIVLFEESARADPASVVLHAVSQ